jgi:membrane glycosyltransferase
MEWKAQTRQDHRVSWKTAARRFWPHTLIGIVPLLALAASNPAAIPFAMLIGAGPLLSIPFAVFMTSPRLGRAMTAVGLCRLPEESDPPSELLALRLPALELRERMS